MIKIGKSLNYICSILGRGTVMDKYLPQHWRDWIVENKYGKLMVCDFDGSVVLIDFEDGSSARFNYAFYVVSEEHKELAVFTEHCGYYVFPLRGLKYTKLKVVVP